MLLDVDTKAVVDRDVTIIDPWNPGATDRVLGNIAIGMRLGCKNATQCPLVVFSDSDFFSSPIWSERPYPVAKVVSGTPEHEEWKARVQKLTADALRIGTEAGADILLYWDGKAFSLFWGAEEA